MCRLVINKIYFYLEKNGVTRENIKDLPTKGSSQLRYRFGTLKEMLIDLNSDPDKITDEFLLELLTIVIRQSCIPM